MTTMRTMILKTVLLTIIMIFILSTSGCIDIHLAKSFIEKEAAPLGYINKHQWTISHQFDTTLDEEEMPVHIRKDTLWLNFSIEISMERSLGFFRYVNVVIYEPGERPGIFKEYYARTFNTTTIEAVNIENPSPGEWKFSIEGRGGSVGDINDGYYVEVWTYELDRRT